MFYGVMGVNFIMCDEFVYLAVLDDLMTLLIVYQQTDSVINTLLKNLNQHFALSKLHDCSTPTPSIRLDTSVHTYR